jgi:hypothetical protein
MEGGQTGFHSAVPLPAIEMTLLPRLTVMSGVGTVACSSAE